MKFWVGLALVGSALLLAPLGAQEEVRALPRPPFSYYHPAGKPRPKTRLRLAQLSQKRDTSPDGWVRSVAFKWPTFGADLPNNLRGRIPEDARSSVDGARLVQAIEGRRHAFLLYGPDFSGGRYLVALDPITRQESYAFDFQSYITPPAAPASEREFVDEMLQWAQEADGLLYVSNFHRTYAKSSRGQNGYLTALDPKTGRIRWRSRPLVCNTGNFLILGDAIITGYGFTREPDFIYVLDRATGAVVQTLPVKSGPELFAIKDGKLHVKCYDASYVFGIKR